MLLSAFNLYVENVPEPGSVLVNNTFSGAFAIIDDETMRALRRADAGESLSADELQLVSDPDLSDPDVGIVVHSREQEEADFRAWFERRRARTTQLEVIVGVNLACNFDCPYCSQATLLDGSVMAHDIADQTVDWLVKRATEVGVEKIFPMFCGGEPLLHPKRVEHMARRLRDACEAAGLSFGFGLITNGYFLTPELVDRFVALGLEHAKITLDGDETTHKTTRVSKKGEDTFERIFAHVIYASRRLRVVVNGNYQEDTVSGFAPLIGKLARAGLAPGSAVSFTPALAGLGAVEGSGTGSCTWSGSSADYQLALADEARRHGFEPAGPSHVVGPCEFHDHNSFAIDPDGTIHKCPGFMGRSDWGIGHVSSGLTDRYQQMLAATPQPGCVGCAHRPNCGGGCVAHEWLRTGQMEGVNCEHDYFERVKAESLTREFILATADSAEAALAQFPPTRADLSGASDRSSTPPSASRGRRSAALKVLAA